MGPDPCALSEPTRGDGSSLESGCDVLGHTGYELLGDGQGIQWPDLDEDVSVAGLLRGERAR
jgi:hypothetical protein